MGAFHSFPKGVFVFAVASLFASGAQGADKPLPKVLNDLAQVCQARDGVRAAAFRSDMLRNRTSKPGWRIFLDGGSQQESSDAAAQVASGLGAPVIRADLGALVSKYIGETEKNLVNLFARAEASNAVLFFDEADALFGKRTDVGDAHDRYDETSTTYVLRRLEAYEGVVILASNKPMPASLRARIASRSHAVVPLGPKKPLRWQAVCRPPASSQ